MSEPNNNPSTSEEIKMGMANACTMFPGDAAKRREEIEKLHHLGDEEKEAVKRARDEVGLKDHAKRLTKIYGVAKATQQIMKILDAIKKPGDRAAVITQVGLLSQDVGYMDKDLVTLAQDAAASAGQQQDDTGALFDKTSEGQRRGGKKAEPKAKETKAEPAAPAPTSGLPLDEALRRFEAAKEEAGWSGKGFMPKSLKPLKEAVDAARAAEGPTEALREGNAESDAHIRKVAEDRAAKRSGSPELDDDIPEPAPRRQGFSGLGPDAIH